MEHGYLEKGIPNNYTIPKFTPKAWRLRDELGLLTQWPLGQPGYDYHTMHNPPPKNPTLAQSAPGAKRGAQSAFPNTASFSQPPPSLRNQAAAPPPLSAYQQPPPFQMPAAPFAPADTSYQHPNPFTLGYQQRPIPTTPAGSVFTQDHPISESGDTRRERLQHNIIEDLEEKIRNLEHHIHRQDRLIMQLGGSPQSMPPSPKPHPPKDPRPPIERMTRVSIKLESDDNDIQGAKMFEDLGNEGYDSRPRNSPTTQKPPSETSEGGIQLPQAILTKPGLQEPSSHTL